jgi:hypothetical protein
VNEGHSKIHPIVIGLLVHNAQLSGKRPRLTINGNQGWTGHKGNAANATEAFTISYTKCMKKEAFQRF